MLQKDGRVKVMAEILRGIRVIKFHVWEDHFVEKIGSEYDKTVLISFRVLQVQWNGLLVFVLIVFIRNRMRELGL
jgi:hypothetical protein